MNKTRLELKDTEGVLLAVEISEAELDTPAKMGDIMTEGDPVMVEMFLDWKSPSSPGTMRFAEGTFSSVEAVFSEMAEECELSLSIQNPPIAKARQDVHTPPTIYVLLTQLFRSKKERE